MTKKEDKKKQNNTETKSEIKTDKEIVKSADTKIVKPKFKKKNKERKNISSGIEFVNSTFTVYYTHLTLQTISSV